MENKQNEIIKDVTSEDKSKLEVVLKRDSMQDVGAEIDLMNIFTNMGKRKKIYVWFILFCLFIGLLVPALIPQIRNEDAISAIISLRYPGAEDELAPDGTELDLGKVMASNIVQAALNRTYLSYNLTASQVSTKMKVEKVLTDATNKQLEILQKYENTQYNEEYIKRLTSVEMDYKTSYIITLENGYTVDNKYVKLPGTELATLLNNIIDEYRKEFFEEYGEFKLPDNKLADISLDELDYIEWLDCVNDILDSLEAYCKEPNRVAYNDYRSHKTGLTFNDISELVALVKDVQVEYLYSHVYFNCLSKDKENTLTNFNYRLLALNKQLDIINEKITTGKSVIENYKNDNILVTGAGDETDEEYKMNVKRVTDYYNSLIMQQADYYVERASLTRKIANMNDKIEGFSAGTGTAYQISVVETETKHISDIMQKLYDLVKAQAEEIGAGDSYMNSFVTTIDAVYYEEAFVSLPDLLLLCKCGGIGLLIGLLVWAMDGLILELKDSSARAKAAKQ